MSDVKLSLLIDDDMLSSVSHVVENCKNAGLQVDSVLGEIGVITGTIDGPHRCYCIRKEAFQEMQEWFEKR